MRSAPARARIDEHVTSVGPILRCRPATVADEPFLWEMLFLASRAGEDPSASVAGLRGDPSVARLVAQWGRSGDIGVIAMRDEVAVGAAWLRLLIGEERRSPAYVDATTPEIAIAVQPGSEGNGLGTMMMTALLDAARGVHQKVTLNVRCDNPALRLYERLGFEVVEEIVNRVGGPSVKMLLSLEP